MTTTTIEEIFEDYRKEVERLKEKAEKKVMDELSGKILVSGDHYLFPGEVEIETDRDIITVSGYKLHLESGRLQSLTYVTDKLSDSYRIADVEELFKNILDVICRESEEELKYWRLWEERYKKYSYYFHRPPFGPGMFNLTEKKTVDIKGFIKEILEKG